MEYIDILDNSYTLPDSLAEITLDKHMQWSATYGFTLKYQAFNAAARFLEKITDIEELNINRTRQELLAMRMLQQSAGTGNLNYVVLAMERIYMGVAYYTGITYELIKNEDIDNLASGYALSAIQAAVEEIAVDLTGETIIWDGDEWEINLPEASVGDPISKYEFGIHLLNARYMIDIINGDWQGAKSVCAAYLRKTGEDFDQSLYESRLEVMAELPLNIAFGVIQYLAANLDNFEGILDAYLTIALYAA